MTTLEAVLSIIQISAIFVLFYQFMIQQKLVRDLREKNYDLWLELRTEKRKQDA